MNPTLETCAAALRRNRFDVRVVATSEEADLEKITENPECGGIQDSENGDETGL